MSDRSAHRTMRRLACGAALVAASYAAVPAASAQSAGRPFAQLLPAPTITLPGDVDSNSPAVWELVDGRWELRVLTSTNGAPSVSSGPRLARLGGTSPVGFVWHPGHGVWMEAVVVDDAGTWYGYYHHEIPAETCGRTDVVIPRIGAARSTDGGRTWDPIGTVLEAAAGTDACDTTNRYFAGGVGDVSVMLDAHSQDLYFFYSQYGRNAVDQGVAVARLLWADRDAPAGRLSVWQHAAWLPSTVTTTETGEGDTAVARTEIVFPSGSSPWPTTQPWHDADPNDDAFWGPSVHWNTALGEYVMLLNRTRNDDWEQDGIYVSFASTLDDPSAWSTPERLVEGGAWYPQVLGTELQAGTDKLAGERARFFVGGKSTQFIQFSRR